jgi:hypothetical protein
MNPNAQPQQPAAEGAIDIAPIVQRVRDAIPKNLQAIYDKAILSGLRIMFDKASHKMMLEELQQPGPLTTRISNGIIKLVYLLWTQSNKTLPPQIMVPITLTLALRAFEFLQESKDPEATKEVLGEATHEAVQGVMDRFGATADKLPGLVKGQGAQPGAAPAAPPAPAGGMLAAAAGGQHG